jgi:hypothetical protein
MGLRIKLLTVVAAVSVLAVAAGAASGSRILVSEQSFWMPFLPMTIEGGRPSLMCNVTLYGSFHGTAFAKVIGEDIGDITLVRFGGTGRCAEARVFVPLAGTMPWHLRYAGFTGALPRITSIRVKITAGGFLLIGEGGGQPENCLYEFTNEQEFAGAFNVEAGGVISGFTLDATRRIRITRPIAESCSEVRTFAGTSSGVMPEPVLPTPTPVTISLI